MGTPPTFQRSPRHYPVLPDGKVEIPSPPSPPTAPSGFSPQTMLLPLGGTALGIGITYAASSAYGSFNPLFLAASVPMVLASSGGAWWSAVAQRRAYHRDVRAREETFQERIKSLRSTLERQQADQRAVLCQKDPSPGDCARRARDRDSTLWERSPSDPDFLQLRLGLGKRPNSVTVTTPTPAHGAEADPLAAECRLLAETFSDVSDVPICLPLGDVVISGIKGPRSATVSLARALALQLATHHSPDEVKIVGIFPETEAADWDWLRWLPHVWSDDGKGRYLASTPTGASELLSHLNGWLKRRAPASAFDREGGPPLPAFVFLLADARLYQGDPILSLLLDEDNRAGAYSIFVDDRLPHRCQAVIDVTGPHPTLVAKKPSPATTQLLPDQVTADDAEDFARSLAPLRLKRLAPTSQGLPDRLPLLSLLSSKRVDDLDVMSRWRSGDPARSLAIPIGGQTGDTLLWLDLHEQKHGPHGLVAGQTRWGKTAFLRAFITTLAATFHPHEVAFVLIDYKGGDLFRDLGELPHVVGVIDNLQEHLARRALLALGGELRRRQERFKEAGVGTIERYQRLQRAGRVAEPLPHLFLICDEFKELMREQPDFAQQFISTACVGGSLGVHLVLATQQPEGVVSDQIWTNTRFRICFHFDRPEDSSSVLRRPDASTITVRGRGYLQVGDNETFELFQSGFGDLAYTPETTDNSSSLFRVDLDGKRIPFTPIAPTHGSPATAETTQIREVAKHLSVVARQYDVAPLPRFWQPPLPLEVDLTSLRTEAGERGWDGAGWQPAELWLQPIIGLMDDPARQRQGVRRLDFAGDGHLAVYGGAQTGKTTFLQSLVVSLALSHSPADVVFYLLDFGGQLLTQLLPLPHVGGVIVADEPERLNWLLRYLAGEQDRRKKLFSQVGVTNLSAYRQTTAPPLPAIVVALDNYAGFAAAFPDAEGQLARLAQEGASLGTYFVVTSTTPQIRQRLKDSLSQVVAFRLVQRMDYLDAVGRTNGLEPEDVPGRGLIRADPPLEFQTALPVSGDDFQRSGELRSLALQLDRAWTGVRPPTVPTVPDVIQLSDLLAVATRGADRAGSDQNPSTEWRASVGLDLETLEPLIVDLDDGPHFLITGPVGGGKTTLLQSWILGLASRSVNDSLGVYLVDYRQGGLRPLAEMPPVKRVRGYVTGDERLSVALDTISQDLRDRSLALQQARQAAADGAALDDREFLARYPRIVVVLDHFDAFKAGVSYELKQRFEETVNLGRDLGFHLILASSSTDLKDDLYGNLLRPIKRSPTGFILGTSEYEDLQILNQRPPGGVSARLPPGQGFYTARGYLRRVKVAVPGEMLRNLTSRERESIVNR